MRLPSTRIAPESGCSSPSISFRTTDFPQPLAPSRIFISPRFTAKEMSRRTTLSSKASETWSNATIGTSSGDPVLIVTLLLKQRQQAKDHPAAGNFHGTAG